MPRARSVESLLKLGSALSVLPGSLTDRTLYPLPAALPGRYTVCTFSYLLATEYGTRPATGRYGGRRR